MNTHEKVLIMTQGIRNKRKEMAIQNAISNWTDAKNGKYHLMNSYAKDKTPEYCEEQIQYFKNLKL